MNIAFIGLGKLGLPCAEAIAERGHSVCGYDIEPPVSNKVTTMNSIEETVSGADIVFVAVPTPHHPQYDGSSPTSHLDPKDFSYGIVSEVLVEANKHMTESQLLVLISTVLPGTTRREFAPLITNTRFVYNPYLIAMGSVAWDMVNPEMVMIGTSNGSENGDARHLVEFYKTIMQNNPRYVIGTWDECECIKVFYNTFISTKISLVNMIQDVAQRQGNINVDVVTKALAESTMRIMGPQYMTAGMGDGGSCHPRDNIALRYMAQQLDLGYDLFETIMTAREIQAKNLAKFLVQQSQATNFPIWIHGRAYKPGVPHCDGSYSLLIEHWVKQSGHIVHYIDPLTGDVSEPNEPCVMLLAHSPSTTYKYTKNMGTTVYSTGGTVDNLYCDIPQKSVIVDPWRKFADSRYTVIHYGNTRLPKII